MKGTCCKDLSLPSLPLPSSLSFPFSPALPEVPPIPCHVHAGEVKEGCCEGHGKTEAYFFPPVDVPPYNLTLGPVKTRLGLRPDVTREQVSLVNQQMAGDLPSSFQLFPEYKSCCSSTLHSEFFPPSLLQVLAALSQFGQTDDFYSLLNEYEIRPWETWTIEQKIVHAPGKCVYYKKDSAVLHVPLLSP